jgi:fibronectin type 3 domain-containing protein
VQATAQNGQINLTWTAVPGATSYNVYRGTASGQELYLTNVLSNSFTDTGVFPGTPYFYKVTAGNNAGEGSQSIEASATMPPDVPLAPSNVYATAQNGQINLTWPAVPGATSYNIYRGTASGQELYLTNVPSNSFTDTGVLPGTPYFYKVTAGNDAGEGRQSIETDVPPAPTGVAVQALLGGVNVLTWAPVAGATGYVIFRNNDGAPTTFNFVTSVQGMNNITFVDNVPDPGLTYFYRVAAFNSAAQSDLSAEVFAITPVVVG